MIPFVRGDPPRQQETTPRDRPPPPRKKDEEGATRRGPSSFLPLWRTLLSLKWKEDGARGAEEKMVSDRGRTERCYIQIRVDDGMRRERERERGRRGSRVGSLSWQVCVCALAHTEDCGGSYSKQREAPKPSSRHAILSFHNDRVPSRLQPEFQYTRIFNEPSPVLRQPSIPYPRGLPLPPANSFSPFFFFFFFLVFFFHSRAVTARSFSAQRASFEARPRREHGELVRYVRIRVRIDFFVFPRGEDAAGRARRRDGEFIGG